MVQVMYVGNKPTAFDNVAGSRKLWEGFSSVQEVTPAQAKILTGYADQWKLVDPEDQAALDAPKPPIVTPDGAQVAHEDLTKPLEKMSKPELIAYAQHVLGKTLAPTTAKKVMIDEITLWKTEQGK